MPELDLCVVGAGPAGLALAIRARLAGMSVAVLDRRHPPIDRACGEGLMPDASEHLAPLGVAVPEGESAPFLGIRYVADGLAAEGRFAHGSALGVRRTALHGALVERAAALGAELRFGAEATGLCRDGVRTGDRSLKARFVVGADGRHSAVRRWAGLEGRPARRDRHAVRRHYELEPWSDLVEVHWGDQVESYVTPVGPRCVCVAMLWNGGATTFDRLLERVPALGRRLAVGRQVTRDRGASRIGARPRAVAAGRLALIGDAAGGVDPITGEGVALAFRQAATLLVAIAAGDLAGYASACAALAARPRRMAGLLLLLERSAPLRRRVIAALAADPRLFSRLLEVHTGAAGGGAALAAFAGLALRAAAARPPAAGETRGR